MLLPEPVGATDRTSRPASMAATTSDCPGLKASRPKTSLSVRSALFIIPPECDGIRRRDQPLLTPPDVESGRCRSSHGVTGRKKPGEKPNGKVHLSSVRRRVEVTASGLPGAKRRDRRLRQVSGGRQGCRRVSRWRPLPTHGCHVHRHLAWGSRAHYGRTYARRDAVAERLLCA